MRNTHEYPITYEEVLEQLQSKIDYDLKMGYIGGTGPLILSYIIKYLQLIEVKEDFSDWLQNEQNATR